MSSRFTFLAFSIASLTAGLSIHQTSQTTESHFPESVPLNISTHALAKRTTANPPFDPWDYNRNMQRTDNDLEGDIYRLTKCYCVDTPSRDLPPVYGQYYGSYYGFDYYNYHLNQSYAYSWTCASGELETLNTEFAASDFYFLAPKCLSWMEEEKKQCWDTGDGNEFCAEAMKGKDYYYWNGQKRKVRNHPPADGTVYVKPPRLNDECQRMCQTVPANTVGWMQDTIPSDRDNRINLATATVCSAQSGVGADMLCAEPGGKVRERPKKWETWNFMETYSDQADMCKGCA
ncbi:hypothetical protein IMSHALPRED_005624 [Imshaugia aleurites]|uniref:Uncharacterized protein n=1 Tax=Imshaugia aleurites TaxID=172621 RepID=A0A8H3IP25_9LECA|nr:hypothetical protein IMSHALPRED_005624 [Imshaugia aleurites]